MRYLRRRALRAKIEGPAPAPKASAMFLYPHSRERPYSSGLSNLLGCRSIERILPSWRTGLQIKKIRRQPVPRLLPTRRGWHLEIVGGKAQIRVVDCIPDFHP